MGVVRVVIEVDEGLLSSYEDRYLAVLWHVAQVNPVPFGDRVAGELVEGIGREIIGRWLGAIGPELWCHQGQDHWRDRLRQVEARCGAWTFVAELVEPASVRPAVSRKVGDR